MNIFKFAGGKQTDLDLEGHIRTSWPDLKVSSAGRPDLQGQVRTSQGQVKVRTSKSGRAPN